MSNEIWSYCPNTAGCILGESPVWVEGENALYWTDIKGKAIFRREFPSGRISRWDAPLRISSFVTRQSGGFIGSSDRGIVAIDLERDHFEIIANPEVDRRGNRFNDGKVDRVGAFWTGSMDDAEVKASGALYRFDHDLRWHRMDDGYGVTNGPAFSPDGRTLYHTDSAQQTIYRFDLAADGLVANRRVFAQFDHTHGYPDGMTVDAEGCLWVAFWDGWCIRRLSPDGQPLVEIDLPVQRPTSCAFGGAALDVLFITSAAFDLDEREKALQPLAGGLFAINTGTIGIAEMPFAG